MKNMGEFIWQSDSMQKLPKSLNMNIRYEIGRGRRIRLPLYGYLFYEGEDVRCIIICYCLKLAVQYVFCSANLLLINTHAYMLPGLAR